MSLASVTYVAAALPDLRLIQAVKQQDTSRVRELLKQRVDVNTPQPDGATALHWAAHWGDATVTDLLVRAGANVNARNHYGVTPLALACTARNLEVVDRLLAAGADPNVALQTGETPLMTAARTGNPAIVRSLLFRRADVNARERTRGQTALMWAAGEGHASVVRMLLESGADVKARSSSGYTPLLFAAWKGDEETTRVLLEAGADINNASDNGSTPLMTALTRGYTTSYFDLLLDHGADINDASAGYTVLHWAAGTWDTGLTILLRTDESEWNPIAGLREPQKLEFVKKLVARGADVNARITRNPGRVGGGDGSGSGFSQGGAGNVLGATPFFLAAAGADVPLMQYLKDAGADPTVIKKDGQTVLMAAVGIARQVGTTLVTESESLAAAKYLVELGAADLNAADQAGDTALHAAAYWGHNSVVQFLVEQGEEIDPQNKMGNTPYMIATGQGPRRGAANAIHPDTGELFGKLGANTDMSCPFPCLDNVYGKEGRSRKK